MMLIFCADLTVLPLKEVLSSSEEKAAIHRADIWRYFMLVILFVILTASQVISPVHLVFPFAPSPDPHLKDTITETSNMIS